ncbi:MAG TPA: hypothetical protein DCO71_00855 [Gammaproteobacteria bacterium]|nr:hypothetical protein [Gammaproteobacteria bacterium]
MLVLPLITLLSACEEPQTAGMPAEEPAIPAATPLTEAATMPSSPESGLQEEDAPPADETRKPDSLKLRIDDRPVAAEAPSGFGAAPDSAWLDTSQEGTGTDTGQDELLPDLFGEQAQQKPVSVKGKMLLGDEAQEFSGALDGAQMSIEIKTD